MASMAAVAALVVAAFASAASADTFYKCSRGQVYVRYCTAVRICVVPRLQGDTQQQASNALLRHDCTLGKTKYFYTRNGDGLVAFSSPPAGSYRDPGWPVDIYIAKGPYKPARQHHHK
jgi:beta-lactam-binding protein with PASTA domain